MKFKRKSKAVNTPKNTNAPTLTIITQNTDVKADINCKDDLRIAGYVEGEIESKQKTIVSETGRIKGNIITPNADISGKINGELLVSNKLTLRSTAKVEGKIHSKKLIVEDGAQIIGDLQVGLNIELNKKSAQNSSEYSNTQKQSKDEINDADNKSVGKNKSGSSKLSA